MKNFFTIKFYADESILKYCYLMITLYFCIVPSLFTTDYIPQKIAALLVIDVSGSMRITDPERIVRDGAQIFVNLLPTDGSSAGILLFDEEEVGEFDFADMSIPQNRKDISEFISNIEFGQNDTDIGLALRKAYQVLDNTRFDDNTSKIVLFFTDGMIDLKDAYNSGRSPRGQTNATAAETISKMDVERVIASAKYPIYAIGLYPNRNIADRYRINDEDINFLHNIALSTSTNEALIAREASQLRKFFTQIYADIRGEKFDVLNEFVLGNTEMTTRQLIHVPNFIREVNIAIEHKGSVNFNLEDPSGSIITDNEKVIINSAPKHTEIRLVSPITGAWLLRMQGEQGIKVYTTLIRHFDFDIKIAVEPDKVVQGKTARVYADIQLPQNSSIDLKNYNPKADTIKAVMYVNEIETGEMEFESGRYYIDHIFSEKGEVIVGVVVSSRYYEKKTNKMISARALWIQYIYLLPIFLIIGIGIFVVYIHIKYTNAQFPEYFYEEKKRENRNPVEFNIYIEGDPGLESPQPGRFTPTKVYKKEKKDTGSIVFFIDDGEYAFSPIPVRVFNKESMELKIKVLKEEINEREIEIKIGDIKVKDMIENRYIFYYDKDSIKTRYYKKEIDSTIEQSCVFNEQEIYKNEI